MEGKEGKNGNFNPVRMDSVLSIFTNKKNRGPRKWAHMLRSNCSLKRKRGGGRKKKLPVS